ncbi:MAG: tetratricopeptide repeat protein [Anaerolineae bacterium]
MEQTLPLNNLGLYRMQSFVGRAQELRLLTTWLNRHPVLAISGPSGAGKSTLATALAVAEASRFKEGILWISATGDTTFNFYDIVRSVEDVLATGITNQPVGAWPLLVLQQLYGYNRLLIIDELTDADSGTVEQIINIIGQIGPGGQGRFILIGRTIPQPLLNLVGEAHLRLGGIGKTDVQTWIEAHHGVYPLTPADAPLLHQLTGGHPLALKMVATLWRSPDWGQLIDLVSVQNPHDWEARLKAIITAALSFLRKKHPPASELLTRCSLASGGFTSRATGLLYWGGIAGDESLKATAQELIRFGLLMHNPQANRYFIHPLLRRYLAIASYPDLTRAQQRRYATDHARYYLVVAQRYNRTPLNQWHTIDGEWGNIRKAFDFLVHTLEDALDASVHRAFAAVDAAGATPLPPHIDHTLILLRDYALALSNYVLWRHPPEGRHWMSAGIVAARHLHDRRAEAMLGLSFAGLVYFHQDYTTAHTWFRRSLPYFKEVGDIERVVRVTKDLGIVQRALGNLQEALQTFTHTLTLATDHNLSRVRPSIQSLIGSVYYGQKNYSQAIRWHQKALSLDRESGNLSAQAVHHNNIALALEAKGNYEQAIDHYRQAVTLHQQSDNKKGLSTTYGNLGAAFYQLGNPAEALKWYKLDRALRDAMGNWLDLAAILHNMGHIALELDDLKAAARYFTQSRDLYRQFGQNDLAEEEEILLNTIKSRRVVVG